MICSICIEKIKTPLYRNDGVVLKCEHKFHKKCLIEWWKRILIPSCPYCRRCYNQDSTDMEFSIDSLLVKYGSCNLRKEIDISNDNWICDVEDWVLNDDYIVLTHPVLITMIKSGHFLEIASGRINSLIKRGFFKRINSNSIQYQA